jgi:hypothetical protein
MSKSIPQLSALTTLSDSDLLHVVSSNIDYKITVGNLRTALNGGSPKICEGLLSQQAASTVTSGSLPLGSIWTLTTYVAGDDFSNMQLISGTVNTTGSVFRVIGVPTTFTNGSTLDYDGSPFWVSKNTLGNYAPFINTLGVNPTLTYSATGIFKITATGLFVLGKTTCELEASNRNYSSSDVVFGEPNDIYIYTDNTAGSAANGKLTHTHIIIKVYP